MLDCALLIILLRQSLVAVEQLCSNVLFPFFVPGLYGRNNGELVKRLNNDFLNIAPITLMFGETCPKGEEKRVASEIREFYFGKSPIDNSTRFNLVDVSVLNEFRLHNLQRSHSSN